MMQDVTLEMSSVSLGVFLSLADRCFRFREIMMCFVLRNTFYQRIVLIRVAATVSFSSHDDFA